MLNDLFHQVNLNTIVIAFGALFMWLNQNRFSTINDFKDALAAKELVITNLQNTIDTNKAKADGDIKALQAQIDNLKKANVDLQNVVTGKETLEAIQKTLNGFIPLMGESGLLAEFKKNDELILKTQEDILETLREQAIQEGALDVPLKQ